MAETKNDVPPLISLLGLAIVVIICTLPSYLAVCAVFRVCDARVPNMASGAYTVASFITIAVLAGLRRINTPVLVSALSINVVFVTTWMIAALFAPPTNGCDSYDHRASLICLGIGFVPLLVCAALIAKSAKPLFAFRKARVVEEQRPSHRCPKCDAAYDPHDYSNDSARWFCSQCKAELPRSY